MTEKLFVNIGNEIFLNGKWWCSVNGEHCADVITPALNELLDENEQLKTQLQNISDQRDEFHRVARENANRVGKLEKEIESLVCENQQLKGLKEEVFNNE